MSCDETNAIQRDEAIEHAWTGLEYNLTVWLHINPPKAVRVGHHEDCRDAGRKPGGSVNNVSKAAEATTLEKQLPPSVMHINPPMCTTPSWSLRKLTGE